MTHLIVDISSNNPHPIDWANVKAAGIEAVFIKATEGSGYTNPYYASDRDGARAVGILVAAYHFADWTNVAAESTHFLSVAGADARILDIEASTDVTWSTTFLTALPFPSDRLLGYGSSSSCIIELPALPWVADPGAPSAPSPKDAALQYTWTGSVDGIGGNVDVSEWVGSEAQWTTFWSLTPPQSSVIRRSSSDMGLAQAVRPDGSGIDVVAIDASNQIRWQGNTPYWVPGNLVAISPQPPKPPVALNLVWYDADDMVLTAECTDGNAYINAMHPSKGWTWGSWVTTATNLSV